MSERLRATLPDDSWIEEVGPVGGVEMLAWDMAEPVADPAGIRYVVHPYLHSAQALEQVRDLPDVQAVQLLTAGYETALPYLPDGVALCNAAGVHDASTAEQALTLTLAALRGVPEFVAAQQRSKWLPTKMWPALADRAVLIVGYGSIGRAIAARLLPFETTVTAVASRARDGDDLVSRVHGIDEVHDLLPTHDVVVLICPLTESTAGLVDARFLGAMKEGALLVNVARGGVVRTDDLVAALQAGRIRAALDVTDPEPLPADHPLWHTPGVLIAPHVGGASTAFRPRAVRLIRQQLQALAAGQRMANIVAGG